MANAVQKTQTSKQVQEAGQQLPRRLDGGERTSLRPTFMPLADIYETPEAIVVLADMPGIDPDRVDITLEGRTLTIHGTTSGHDHKGYQQIYAEYADGDCERIFTLSEDIDRGRTEATLKSGVLHLVLPKAESAKARKIKLKAA